MEPKFSTSFIPKQTLAKTSKAARPARSPKGALTLLFMLSIVAFIGSAGIGAVVYFNSQILKGSLQEKQDQLTRAREAFQPELIRAMSRFDERLAFARLLLDTHVAPSEIFSLLQEFTLTTVRFSTFHYDTTNNETVNLNMQGTARSFSSIALQSDEFVRSKIILNPVFSNFRLNPNGSVGFTFSGNIDPSFISYSRIVDEKVASGELLLP